MPSAEIERENDMGRLDGKVIVVAGAGGIGTGLTRRYAAEGARVLVGDVDLAAAESAAAEAQVAGGTAVGILLDGADEASIRAAVERATADFGGIDGFHTNFAGMAEIDGQTDVVGIPMEAFDEIVRVGVRGVMLCTRIAIPALLARGGGSLLYTSSGAAFEPQTVRVGYSMSKVAMHALMRHVAMRYGPEGIRANALTPGMVTHAKFERVVPKDFAQAMVEKTPRRRLGQPADVAAMSAFLMSDDAGFVTGQVISIDGGRTMRQ